MMSFFSRVARKSGFLSQRLRLLSTSSSLSQISAKGNNSLLINHNNPYLEIYSTDANGNDNGGEDRLFNHKTLVYSEFPKIECCRFPEESSLDQLYVSGPCYGLVCAYSDWQHVCLLNPTTRDIKHFPLNPYEAYPDQNHLLGFGFDSKTNEFKIVRSTTYINPGPSIVEADLHYIEIFSLNSPQAQPRDLPVLGEIRSLRPSRSGVPSVDGVCYWSAKDPFDVNMKVVSFDFTREVFDLFTLPPCDYMNYNLHTEDCLMETFNGLSAAIRYDVDSQDKCFEVWVKKKETWVKHMSIGPISDVIKPLGFFNNDGLILLDSDNRLVLCDFSTKQLRKLDIKLPKPTKGQKPLVHIVNLSEKLVPASHSVLSSLLSFI